MLFQTGDQGDNGNNSWLIPASEVLGGGPGKDGIPALENPILVTVDEVASLNDDNLTFLDDDDLVIGFRAGDEARAYPHTILDWHEIINDQIAGLSIAITYCPLTGSGIGWDRMVNGVETTFGVSGLLYNSNLIPYDRATDSNWSQMKLQCVNGEYQSTEPDLHAIVEMTWGMWKSIYPDTKVVSNQTGYSRNYGIYPYGGYKTTESLLFSVSNVDRRLHMKERTAGIIVKDSVKVYRLSSFADTTRVVNDVFRALPIVAVGNSVASTILIYGRTADDGTVLEFQALQDQWPNVMIDTNGTTWDIFGRGVSGPRMGERLPVMKSFMAYWFAWAAFYPDPVIFEESS